MTDLELCKNKDYYAIFTKYTLLFYKIWDGLSPILKFKIWTEEGDFFSFCYEKTVVNHVAFDGRDDLIGTERLE
mgnify:CR=1 FL=1